MKKPLFLEHFFMIFKFLHGSAYTSYKNYLLNYLFSIFCILFTVQKAAKNEEKILLKKIVRMMRNIMMKMMKIMTI